MKLPKIELRNFDVSASLEVSENPDRCAIDVVVLLHVKDRVTGEPNQVVMREGISERGARTMSAEVFAGVVRDAVKRALLHELDECFYVDGVRTRDPHKDEP